MKSKTKFLLPVLLVAAAAPLSAFGCGSNGDGGDTSAPLTKAAFLEEGNEICQKRLKEKEAAASAALKKIDQKGGNPSKQSLEAAASSTLAPYQELTRELDELPAPENSEVEVDELISELELGVEKGEAKPLILLRVNPFERASKTANDLGLEACVF